MFLSIIIPAYNEEKRIRDTLESVSAYLRTKNYLSEIIVANDGSKDDTSKIVRECAFGTPFLYLIELPSNRGKGFAVREGMLAAKGQYCLFMDADGSTSILEADRFIDEAIRGRDVVISSRRLPESEINYRQSNFRKIGSGVFALLVKWLFDLPVSDSQNGFKLFSQAAASEIFCRQRSERWAFDVEILVIAEELGFSVEELPIVWTDSALSKMTLFGAAWMIFDLVKIKWNLLRGAYRKDLRILRMRKSVQ